MKNLSAFLCSLTLLALPVGAQAIEYHTLQADKSTLGFVYKQMGVAIEGRFRKFSAQIRFDPARPAAAKAQLDLELASIDAGSAEANDEVAGRLWFNTRAFPQARFVATEVKALGGNNFAISGRMTIKGRTQLVTAPFVFKPQGNLATFDGAFVLKRADFAIGEGEWGDFGTVANEVQIKFHIQASAGK